jgi:aryl-alcohol dehydrogenase-like predicted oxidoreductase
VTAGGRLVVGTVQLGTPYGVANSTGQPSRDTAMQILHRADQAGVAAFDCAPDYGVAEELLGEAGVRAPIFTKVRPGVSPSASAERSLALLGRRHIDVLFLHDPSAVEGDGEELVATARRLVPGHARALGASVYTVGQFRAALDDPRIDAIQAPVSVADQRLVRSGLLEEAGRAGKPVYARSVFLQGALMMAAVDLPPHLQLLAPLVGVVDAVVGAGAGRAAGLVAFVRDLPGVTAVVIGSETVAQLEDNLAASSAPPLAEAECDRLLEAPDLPEDVVDPRVWPRP